MTVRTDDGCLAWLGKRTRDQYAVRGQTYIHRWSHEQFVGPIPDDHEVDHLCSRPWCVEPTHLEAVTKQENMRRLSQRVTTCRHGHPYTPENTYRNPKTGRRACKTCRTAHTRRFFEENPDYRATWSRRRKAGGPTP
jgi:hypothetical protein